MSRLLLPSSVVPRTVMIVRILKTITTTKSNVILGFWHEVKARVTGDICCRLYYNPMIMPYVNRCSSLLCVVHVPSTVHKHCNAWELRK